MKQKPKASATNNAAVSDSPYDLNRNGAADAQREQLMKDRAAVGLEEIDARPRRQIVYLTIPHVMDADLSTVVRWNAQHVHLPSIVGAHVR